MNSLCGLIDDAILPAEFLHSAGGVNHLLLSGEERMAGRAQVEVKLGACASDSPCISAGACNLRLIIFRVDSLFHFKPP